MENIVVSNQMNSKKIQWGTITGVTVFHILAVAALFTFSWQNLLAAFITWWVAASWGVGLGYHRLFTHRGFKVSKPVEYLFHICGSLGLQSGAISWVTTHRIHHAFTETEKDPHSPRSGTYWAHIGWIFRGTGQNQTTATMQRYTPDMMKDPIHRVINKYYWVTPVVVGAILFAVGGFPMVLWGIFLRTVMSWHFTWLVNSATHLWGTRRFETRDDSRNNALVALLTFGEGWHNNHHAHPRSANHGVAWYEFDVNYVQLKVLQKLGLAKEVYAYRHKVDEDLVIEPLQEIA